MGYGGDLPCFQAIGEVGKAAKFLGEKGGSTIGEVSCLFVYLATGAKEAETKRWIPVQGLGAWIMPGGDEWTMADVDVATDCLPLFRLTSRM